jgi:hypothetical protein
MALKSTSSAEHDLLGVHLQYGLPARKIRQLHRYPAVETAGAQQRGIQDVRTVGGGQDDHAAAAVEAVHLREELVEGLLALVVAAEGAGVALLADGVYLVYEHDAGGLFIGLLEQVAHLGRAHAHEHLHEFRAREGEERYLGLAGHGLGQQRLAGARRAHQQRALGHVGAYLIVFRGVVQEVHDLGKGLLGLLLAGYVGEFYAGLRGDVDLGPGFSEGHGVAQPVGAAGHFAHQQLAQGDEDQRGQHPVQQYGAQRGLLLHDLRAEGGAGI